MDLPGVDQPDEWDEQSIHEEHHTFLFDDPIRMLVEVVVADVLNCQGHQGCGEKHSDRVLQGEVELLLSSGGVPLEIADLVQNCTHHELVEEDHADQCQVDQENGSLVLTVIRVI